MNLTEYFSARNVLVLLDAPTNLSYPSSGVVVLEKAGVEGRGGTPVDAAADWCRKFSAMITLPNGTLVNDGETDDTDLADDPHPNDFVAGQHDQE